MRRISILASLGISFLVLAAVATSQVTIQDTSTINGPRFDYVLTIILENQGINNTYGSHCSGNCTYITQLANSYSLAEDYSALAHPSLPNYLALTSGGNYDTAPFNRDCYPQSGSCYVSGPGIVDSLTNSGRTWKAYMEDYSGGCTLAGRSSVYLNHHNPFVYYTDIYHNTTRCSRIVDANPGATGYLALPTQLLSDLGSVSTASNYMWLSPNACDDGHNLCNPLNNSVSEANQYLSLLVPRILNTTIFRTQAAALFVTWDESAGGSRNLVTAVWAGLGEKSNYKSVYPYSHYSAVKTIESAWKLPSLTSYDASAIPMTEFFR